MAFLDLSGLKRKFLSQQQAFETQLAKMFIITIVPTVKPLLQKNKDQSSLFFSGHLIASGECPVLGNGQCPFSYTPHIIFFYNESLLSCFYPEILTLGSALTSSCVTHLE